MQTKKIKTTGLIIKQQNIGEQDRLVTVLTKDLGVIRAFAKRAKNIKSRTCAATGLLCYSELYIYKGKSAYVIEDAKLVNMFENLRSDITKVSLAQYFCEIANVCCAEEENAEEQLKLILNALFLLSKEACPQLIIKACVELRLAALSGYMPDLIMCSGCGTYEAESMYFSLTGEITCETCFLKSQRPRSLEISKGILTAMRHIVYSEDKKLFSFTLSDSSLEKLNQITENYLSQKAEKTFSTLQFYKTVSC